MICFSETKSDLTSPVWFKSVKSIVEITGYLREEHSVLKHTGTFDIHGPAYYHDNVIGFTSTENSDSLVIDLSPATGGTVGQVVMLRTQPFQIAILARSLGELLQVGLDGYRGGCFKCGAVFPRTSGEAP